MIQYLNSSLKTGSVFWEWVKTSFGVHSNNSFEKLTLKKNLLKGYISATDNEAYFQGETFGNIVSYVQTHTRTASMKERKEQLIVSIEEVKSVQAAKRILSELGSEEKVGV
ncbi:hypothetical protein [Hymenobacter radiodurans]|uniref:hypothetical protein n=1 Tax=Hymenobacter radiodurans TaxID=2496028 RepID=UPI001404ECF5|nr:hypothetical protein [Hymenobacter radiodurans]